jgi:non-homologous end joining protein Ku
MALSCEGTCNAPRAYWRGYLRLSLVFCPISLLVATSERRKVSFHRIKRSVAKRATASAIARSMKVPADGKVGQDAFVVIRQVIQQTNLVAFAPIVLTSHHIALEPRGKGIMGTLL